MILNEGGTIMCNQNEIAQINLRLQKWMKEELHEEAKHMNMSLNSYLIHIYTKRETIKKK